MPQRPVSVYALALLSVFFQSTVPVAIKWVPADPWVIGLVRLGIAAGVVALVVPFRTGWGRLTGRDRLGLLAMGVLFGLHWLSYFFSIKLGSAQVATIGVVTYGVHVSWLGAVFLAHRVRRHHVMALLLALSGTVLVVGGFDPSATGAFTGLILAVFSGFCFACLPVLHQRHPHVPVGLRTLGQYLFALLVFLPFAGRAAWGSLPASWPGLLYLAAFGTLVAHTLWIRATSVLPTTHSALFYYLIMPIACTLSFFILGERLGSAQVAGAALVVAGSLLGVLGDRRRPN